MPTFSQFTGFGHLEHSDEGSIGERLYRSGLDNVGIPDAFTPGEALDDTIYAAAMTMAAALSVCSVHAHQWDPLRTTYMLPVYEREYGLVPSPGDSLADRRLALQAAMMAKADARRSSVSQALYDFLGEKLVSYRAISSDEIYPEPSHLDLGQPWHGHILPRLFKLSCPLIDDRMVVTQIAGDTSPMGSGQFILVDPGDYARTESVGVSEYHGDGQYTITSPQKPHSEGAKVWAGRYPLIACNKRNSIIIVKSPWATDQETRRGIHRIMQTNRRATSTYDILEESSEGEAGPITGNFTSDVTPIGAIQ